MKVLFVSGSMSNRLQKELYEKYRAAGSFAIQKYYKLMEDGFARNGIEIEALSDIPIPKKMMPFRYKSFGKEKEKNVYYKYVPYIRFQPLYQPFVLLYIMWKVFWWSLRNRKEGVVLCDTLLPCRCIGAAWGSVLGGSKRVAWITDMPGMYDASHIIHYEDMNLLGKTQMKLIRKFSAFIFMTEQTNGILNPNHRPYMIMEGIVDPDMKPLKKIEKDTTRNILYAGGLLEEYGIDYLCQAFMRLGQDNVRLVIYGKGPFVEKLKEYSKQDSRIDFRETVPNDVIVAEEQKATLLVNPRFTSAEYTFYSFPSKNVEYMVSGTPIVTTRLAGIPSDYEPYIYTFDEETIEGYSTTLGKILNKSDEELITFGARAQQFILQNKNAKVQVKKLIDMINKI